MARYPADALHKKQLNVGEDCLGLTVILVHEDARLGFLQVRWNILWPGHALFHDMGEILGSLEVVYVLVTGD